MNELEVPAVEGAQLDRPGVQIGLRQISTVPFRPLGKSSYMPSPWAKGVDTYIPSILAVSTVRQGLAKSNETHRPFPEELVCWAEQQIIRTLQCVLTSTPDDLIGTYEEAVADLSWDKSPGFPYYYFAKTKQEAMEMAGSEVKQKVEKILSGQFEESYFSLTEKSELRERAKVEAGKTRVFMAGDMHHQLASHVLFNKMNTRIMDTRIREHPITIGLRMPGPEFVVAMSNLGDSANDGDLTGCDLRFNLRCARSVRDIRAHFLPTRYHEAVNNLYNAIYCGYVAGLGGIYRLDGNKSGGFNTAHDNSLMTWEALLIGCKAVYPDHVGSYFRFSDNPDLINGDDLAVAMAEGISFKLVCDWLRNYGTMIEALDWTPRPCQDITFLSHNLMPRYVAGFGDFICTAGNLNKLKSSLNWIKRSSTLTFSESCVAHLIGLRICLFPWALEFEEADRILSDYLKTIALTDFIREVLGARLTERQLAILHTRCEGFIFSPTHYQNQVLKGRHRLIKERLRDLANNKQIQYQSMTTTAIDRKIDQILNTLEKRSSLSHDGRSWLIAAADPFHDSDISLAGYPDVNTSSTIVQLVKKQLQIVPPPGLAGANWDCSIVLFPTMAAQTLTQRNQVNSFGQLTANIPLVTPFKAGGLVVNAGLSGGVLWPNASTVEVTPTNFQSTFVDCSDYCRGDVRIIGMGFEVVNTTSALNKQGQVTVYRMPSVPTLNKLSYFLALSAGNTVGYATSPVYNHRFPPGNIADAQLLFGSRSWAAEFGNYTVSRQNSEENKLQTPDWIQDIYTQTDPVLGASTNSYGISQPGFAVEAGKNADIHAPYDMSGAHYTGLSATTTLTVNVRWLIERSPGPNETDLVVLATPSSSYDPLALELYTHCMQRMPPGVMISENPLGEWFSNALSAVAQWAPKIGEFVGNVLPGAAAMGKAIGAGAGAAQGLIPVKKAKPQQQQQKQPLMGSASTTGKRNFPSYTKPKNPKNLRNLPPRNK